MLAKRYKYDGKPIFPLSPLQKLIKKQVESKIQKGFYKFESIPCCICNSENFELLSTKDRFGLYTPVVICKQCGLVQCNPRMSLDSYNNFYRFFYRKLYFNEIIPTDEQFYAQYQCGKNIYSYIKEANLLTDKSSNSLVFEVGCGAGGTLQYFKEKGFEVQGCDLDKDYIEFGKNNYGLNLFFGQITDLSIKKSPDIIIYSHVLEHLLYPNKDLSVIRDKLSEDGFVYIELPGMENLFNSKYMNFLNSLQNAHTYYFTLITLNNLMELNGFKMMQRNREIKGIFKKSHQQVSKKNLKNNYKPIILYLKKMERYQTILNCKNYYFNSINWLNEYLKNYNRLKKIPRFIKEFFIK